MNDFIRGLDGNDLLFGGQGQDTIEGGNGNDNVEGGADPDKMNGGAGRDWLSYAQSPNNAGSTGGVNVDLAAGVGFGADAAGDTFINFENLAGSGFDDALFGSQGKNEIVGGAGDDRIEARGGNDTIRGDSGADGLSGGTGRDNFVSFNIGDSPDAVGARDTIVDFTQGFDRIDLVAVDADLTTAPNDVFTFISTAAFSFTAGELRYSFIGADTLVEGDVDDDAIGDIGIIVLGNVAFVPSDFLL